MAEFCDPQIDYTATISSHNLQTQKHTDKIAMQLVTSSEINQV